MLLSLALVCAAAPTVPLSFHVAATADGLVETREALERRVARANELYASSGLLFSLSSVESLPEGRALDLATAQDRHALADLAPRPKQAVQVFLVRSAKNLDRGAGMIAGVHWRYLGKSRGHVGRRYVILSSSDSSEDTLAHELGHWFGLGHSRSSDNLMAQSSERTATRLTQAQLERIRAAHQAAIRRKELVRP